MVGWRPHLPRGSANFTPRFSPIVRIYPEDLPVLPRTSASFTPNRASIVRIYPEDLPVLPRASASFTPNFASAVLSRPEDGLGLFEGSACSPSLRIFPAGLFG